MQRWIMIGFLLLATASCGAQARQPLLGPPPGVPCLPRQPCSHDPVPCNPWTPGCKYPTFDKAFRTATHNSYWLDRDQPDFFGSGVQQRLIDQLLHEHVRAFELDLHFEAGHPGEFTIYHTSAPGNSSCHYLGDCLQLFQRFDRLVPDHEAVVIVLEFKELSGAHVFGTNGVVGSARHEHRIEDLDRLLWERLGSRLYTPRDFLLDRGCALDLTLEACARKSGRGWPTTDELRGRYLVTVLGNHGVNYWDWLDYASSPIAERAAFPMRSVLASRVEDLTCRGGAAVAERSRLDTDLAAYIELNASAACVTGNQPYIFNQVGDPVFQQRLLRARENSRFWQVEAPCAFKQHAKAGVDEFLASGGIVRSTDAHAPYNNCRIRQLDIAGHYGLQMIQTDFPWGFIHNREPGYARSLPLPSMVHRPLFELADVMAHHVDMPSDRCESRVPGTMEPVARKFSDEALTEPGARLYLHGTGDPASDVHAERWRMGPASGDENRWELQFSTTMETHVNADFPVHIPPTAARGRACFFALPMPRREARGGVLRNSFEICRIAEADAARSVRLELNVRSRNQDLGEVIQIPHNEPSARDPGDLLLITVSNTANAATVVVATAGQIGPDGTPLFHEHKRYSFDTTLRAEGVSAVGGSAMVVGTLNGKPLRATDFNALQPGADRVVDLAWCLDGSCRGAPRPTGEDVRTMPDGHRYIAIHETQGAVFGNQWRVLLTPWAQEVFTSGLGQWPQLGKFFLRHDPPAAGEPFVALYRCVDWRRDTHQYLVSTSPQCPLGQGDYGLSAGVLGYIATREVHNAVPLYHLRKGTQNATGPLTGTPSIDTYAHYFAVGAADRDARIGLNQGWALVSPVPIGWVYPDSLFR